MKLGITLEFSGCFSLSFPQMWRARGRLYNNHHSPLTSSLSSTMLKTQLYLSPFWPVDSFLDWSWSRFQNGLPEAKSRVQAFRGWLARPAQELRSHLAGGGSSELIQQMAMTHRLSELEQPFRVCGESQKWLRLGHQREGALAVSGWLVPTKPEVLDFTSAARVGQLVDPEF